MTDTRREPVPFASVVLRSLPDSAVVAGSMTGDDGGFSLSAPEGSSYLLTVSFIGYLTHEQVCGTSSDLGDIVLEDDVQMLEEAVVVAHRVEHRPNGYHINLRNDPIAKGRQAPRCSRSSPESAPMTSPYRYSSAPHTPYISTASRSRTTPNSRPSRPRR